MSRPKYNQAILIVLILVGLTVLSACVGSYPLSLEDIGQILTGKAADTMEERIFWQLRLPRVVMGLMSGMVLSLSGAIYQTIFCNPLASPDLTGVASGASLGAACAIVIGTGGAIQIMLGAFAAGMISVVFVLMLVHFSRFRQMGSYILAGIIVSSVADAGLMCLKTAADPERELAAIEFWAMGSLSAITAAKLFPNLLVMVIPVCIAAVVSSSGRYALAWGRTRPFDGIEPFALAWNLPYAEHPDDRRHGVADRCNCVCGVNRAAHRV